VAYVFNIPCRGNAKLEHIVEKVKNDLKLQTFWKCSNVMAIDRLGYTDHGPTHVKIVANSALKLLRILFLKKILIKLNSLRVCARVRYCFLRVWVSECD